MSRGKFGLVAVIAMVILATVSSGVMAQDADPPTGDDAAGREDVAKDFFDDNGNFIHPDQNLADAASKYEGGFGGYYFNKDDKSQVYVYMTDTTKTDNAESAFRETYGGQHTGHDHHDRSGPVCLQRSHDVAPHRDESSGR